jgi:hypothetical protein
MRVLICLMQHHQAERNKHMADDRDMNTDSDRKSDRSYSTDADDDSSM